MVTALGVTELGVTELGSDRAPGGGGSGAGVWAGGRGRASLGSPSAAMTPASGTDLLQHLLYLQCTQGLPTLRGW